MTDPREIIARSYDQKDAARRGEPDPWSFDEGFREFRDERLACAERAIAALEVNGTTCRAYAAHKGNRGGARRIIHMA